MGKYKLVILSIIVLIASVLVAFDTGVSIAE